MNKIRNFFARRKLTQTTNSIRDLFTQRNEHFDSLTQKILDRMPGAIEGISELVEEKQIFDSAGVLEWNEVALTEDNGDEDPLIILIGSINFIPGDVVELESGDKITITAETVQYFPPRVIRIGIPLNIAESSKDEIKKFIRAAEESQKQDMEEFEETLQEILAGNDGSNIQVTKKQDTITTAADFDLTQLTEDQRKKLALGQKMVRG